MVIKTCKICGKEFDARGSAKCCGPECSEINNRNVNRKAVDKYRKSDKGKIARKKANKKYEQSEKGKATRKKYAQSEEGKNRKKRFYENNPHYIEKQNKKYIHNKIVELNEKYDGDLDLILKDCPNYWLVREAIMQVEYGKSYINAMFEKKQINPVCEVTGCSDNLVIHHLDSFNLHPEKGADLDNLVVVTKEVHKAFHDQFGWGNNTREQWERFVKEYGG